MTKAGFAADPPLQNSRIKSRRCSVKDGLFRMAGPAKNPGADPAA